MIYKENKGNISQLNEEAGIIYSSETTRSITSTIPGVEEMFRVYFTFTKKEQVTYTVEQIVQAIRPSKKFGSSSKYAKGKYLYVIDVDKPDDQDQRKATLLNKGQVLYNCFILDINIFAKEVLYKQQTALTIDQISPVEPIGTSDVITFKTYKSLIATLDTTKNSTAAGTPTSIQTALTNLTPVTVTNQDTENQQQSNVDAKGRPAKYTLQTLDDGTTLHWALHYALKDTKIPEYKAWYSAAWNTKSNDFNGINGPKTQALIKKLKPYMTDPAVKNDKTGTITPAFKLELLKTLNLKDITGVVVESVQLKTSNVRLINFIKPLIEQLDFDALKKSVPTTSTSVTKKKTTTKKTTKSTPVDTKLGNAVRESLKSAGFTVQGPGSGWVADIPYGGSYYRFFNDGTIKRVDKIDSKWIVQGKVGSWKTDVGLDGNIIDKATAWITTRYGDVITADKLKADMRAAFYPQVTGTDAATLKRIFTEVDALINSTVWSIKMTIEGDEIEDGYGSWNDDDEDLAWDELLWPKWNTDWGKRMNKADALIKTITPGTIGTDDPNYYIYNGAVKSIQNIRACFASGSTFKKIFLNPFLMPITTYDLIYYLNGVRKKVSIQLDF
jgi:hypothetical protein